MIKSKDAFRVTDFSVSPLTLKSDWIMFKDSERLAQ